MPFETAKPILYILCKASAIFTGIIADQSARATFPLCPLQPLGSGGSLVTQEFVLVGGYSIYCTVVGVEVGSALEERDMRPKFWTRLSKISGGTPVNFRPSHQIRHCVYLRIGPQIFSYCSLINSPWRRSFLP
ncbi:hypothetical protein EYC84_003636 [Monilinia fructicola]|uniref:Uncharacterized protein n=1 Tax=Monilinia fructicola TaxID=38448 RepID=A0A5M9K2I1_MONFR|nr:hypothetical protein EYC84_003636 [Monilinia fructicola]